MPSWEILVIGLNNGITFWMVGVVGTFVDSCCCCFKRNTFSSGVIILIEGGVEIPRG